MKTLKRAAQLINYTCDVIMGHSVSGELLLSCALERKDASAECNHKGELLFDLMLTYADIISSSLTSTCIVPSFLIRDGLQCF